MSTSDCICFEYCFKISYVRPTAPATHNPERLLSLRASVSFNICRNSLWPCGPGNKWDYFPIQVCSVSRNILYWCLKATVCDSTMTQHDQKCEHCNHNTVNTADWLLTTTWLSLQCEMGLQENALCILKQCEQLPSILPGMFDTSTIHPRLSHLQFPLLCIMKDVSDSEMKAELRHLNNLHTAAWQYLNWSDNYIQKNVICCEIWGTPRCYKDHNAFRMSGTIHKQQCHITKDWIFRKSVHFSLLMFMFA